MGSSHLSFYVSTESRPVLVLFPDSYSKLLYPRSVVRLPYRRRRRVAAIARRLGIVAPGEAARRGDQKG